MNILNIPIHARCSKCMGLLSVNTVDFHDDGIEVEVSVCSSCRMDPQTEEMVGKRAAAKAQYQKLMSEIQDLSLERDELTLSVGNLKRMERPGDQMEQYKP